jgi:hypothetical protein
MKRKEVIATLIHISDDLDSMGMFDDADSLTRFAQAWGELGMHDVESNPDNDAAEHGFMGEHQYEQEQKLMNEMNNEDALMTLDARIKELQHKPAPTMEEIHELESLLDYRMGDGFDSSNVSSPHKHDESGFVNELQNAGAKVIN